MGYKLKFDNLNMIQSLLQGKIMPTYIDGIGSSQALDTAGEIVDLMGLDCSSLVGGPFNYEHKSDIPAQLVGKILKCKKIFSEEDCETDRQTMYWEKIKIPFLYVMGRLFDDKQDSAKQLAALFLDDAEHPEEQPMVGFSIEGAKIDKKGMTITRSIARKVTITNAPANKTCVAEMVPSKESKKDDLDDIFKTEVTVEFELFKSELNIPMKKTDLMSSSGPSSPAGILENSEIKKAQVPGSKYPPAAAVSGAPKTVSSMPKFGSVGPTGKDPGKNIGTTSSGIGIFSHKPVGDYGQISSQDHSEMAAKHKEMSLGAGTAAERSHHNDKAALHTQAASTASRKEGRLGTALAGKKQAAIEHAKLGKAMSAGSGMAAPGALVGGSALVSESLEGSKKDQSGEGGAYSTGSSTIPKASNGPKKVGMQKNENKWLSRAEEEYEKWGKREEFRKFMAKKLPKLTRGEIDAIGKTMALNKAIKMEKALSRINPMYSQEDKEHSSIRKFDDGVMDAPMAVSEKNKKTLKKGK